MLRHTALFRLREATTPEARETMLAGLASLLAECPTVLSGDYGQAIEAGPGSPNDYDVALHLDFEGAEGYAAYVAHPTHAAVAAFNASLSVEGTTARVDWLYEGPPRVSPGAVRHCEAFVWAAGTDAEARARALAAASCLRAEQGVLSAVAVPDSGGDPRASDWILDVQLTGAPAARAFLEGAAYRTVMGALAQTLDAGRTARITHLQHGA